MTLLKCIYESPQNFWNFLSDGHKATELIRDGTDVTPDTKQIYDEINRRFQSVFDEWCSGDYPVELHDASSSCFPNAKAGSQYWGNIFASVK